MYSYHIVSCWNRMCRKWCDWNCMKTVHSFFSFLSQIISIACECVCEWIYAEKATPYLINTATRGPHTQSSIPLILSLTQSNKLSLSLPLAPSFRVNFRFFFLSAKTTLIYRFPIFSPICTINRLENLTHAHSVQMIPKWFSTQCRQPRWSIYTTYSSKCPPDRMQFVDTIFVPPFIMFLRLYWENIELFWYYQFLFSTHLLPTSCRLMHKKLRELFFFCSSTIQLILIFFELAQLWNNLFLEFLW